MKQKTAPAPVVAVLRYAHKRNGRVTGGITYRVKASDWTPDNKHLYDVTLYNGTSSSCTCPARGSCKHRTGCEQLEQERADKERAKRETAPLNGNNPFGLLRRAS